MDLQSNGQKLKTNKTPTMVVIVIYPRILTRSNRKGATNGAWIPYPSLPFLVCPSCLILSFPSSIMTTIVGVLFVFNFWPLLCRSIRQLLLQITSLAYYVYDIVNRQQSLRDLYLTINERYFVPINTLSESLTILGVCNEIVGDKNTAYYIVLSILPRITSSDYSLAILRPVFKKCIVSLSSLKITINMMKYN
jgi:hypothetical protein